MKNGLAPVIKRKMAL